MEELVVENQGIVKKRIPPQITNKNEAEAIQGSTEMAGDSINGITTGNFLISLLMGGAMQQLWGTIRAM